MGLPVLRLVINLDTGDGNMKLGALGIDRHEQQCCRLLE